MQPEEKQRVAYHESGHALVACSLPNTDPVHKVSIIPRGLAALGYALQRPEDDRYLMTQERAGKPHPGAAGRHGRRGNGLRRHLHRRPERPGAGHRHRPQHGDGVRHEPAGPRQLSARATAARSWRPAATSAASSSHSEQTAREIDEEVKRILDEMLERVRHILAERRQSLEAVTKSLMEQETIDSDELKQIIEETSSGARIVPGTAAEPKRPSRVKAEEPPKDAGCGGGDVNRLAAEQSSPRGAA